MDIFNAGMEPFFHKRLAQREAELRQLLHSGTDQMHAAEEAGPREVSDFKDAASAESLAIVAEANAQHAANELEDVLAAQRRLADHSYGRCTDCDAAIDLGRLMALAATPCCTACQAIREQDAHQGPAAGPRRTVPRSTA